MSNPQIICQKCGKPWKDHYGGKMKFCNSDPFMWDESFTPQTKATPEHQPTCTTCGKTMRLKVPRLGPDGGYVHADTGKLLCGLGQPEPLTKAEMDTAIDAVLAKEAIPTPRANRMLQEIGGRDAPYFEYIKMNVCALERELTAALTKQCTCVKSDNVACPVHAPFYQIRSQLATVTKERDEAILRREETIMATDLIVADAKAEAKRLRKELSSADREIERLRIVNQALDESTEFKDALSQVETLRKEMERLQALQVKYETLQKEVEELKRDLLQFNTDDLEATIAQLTAERDKEANKFKHEQNDKICLAQNNAALTSKLEVMREALEEIAVDKLREGDAVWMKQTAQAAISTPPDQPKT